MIASTTATHIQHHRAVAKVSAVAAASLAPEARFGAGVFDVEGLVG